MATLQGFIDEVIVELRAVTGIDFVPDEVTLSPMETPIAIVYASSGRGRMAPAGSMTYWHDVRVAFLGPVENLEQTNDFVLSKVEPVVEAIYTELSTDGFTNAVNIGDFEYTLGPVQWGGIPLYGLLLDFREVKIQRNL